MHFILAYYGTLPLPTMTWNYLTSGFTEVVTTRRRFSCTLLYLDDAYKNLSPEKFTYFWQIEWDGLKSMKSETAQTLFFSDAFEPLSRCRRLALGTRTWPYLIPPWRRQQVKTLFTSFMSLIERSTQKQVFFFINFVSWNIFIDALGLDFYKGCLLTFAGKDLLCNRSCIFESFVCHFL